MKKKITIFIIILILLLTSIIIYINKNNKENTTLTKVKVAEVAHSIFYAPGYLADSLGYFKEEGLDVEIILTPGADAVMASVLSNEVNIGFCGTEATIYVADIEEKNYFIKYKIIPEPTSKNKDIINIITGKLTIPEFFLSFP